MSAKELALRAAAAVPLSAFERLVPRDLVGFCYHVVSDEPLPHVRHLYPFKTPDRFEADLRFLGRRFRFVSYAELVEALASGRRLGPRAAMLSFDDGFAECHSVVRPILLRLGIPCTFFLVTDALDNRMLVHSNQASLCLDRVAAMQDADLEAALAAAEPLARDGVTGREALVRRLEGLTRTGDPDGARAALDALCAALGVDVEGFLRERKPFLTSAQTRELAADGFSLGGHTRTHPHLGSVADQGRVREEIVGSCRAVADLVPGALPVPVPFAFPHDTDGLDAALVERVLAENPWIGPTFGTGRLRRGPAFLHHRLSVDRPDGAGAGESNLPGYLRRAYLSEAGRALRGAGAAR